MGDELSESRVSAREREVARGGMIAGAIAVKIILSVEVLTISVMAPKARRRSQS